LAGTSRLRFCIARFASGESAPADALYRFFDLTPERIAKAAHALI